MSQSKVINGVSEVLYDNVEEWTELTGFEDINADWRSGSENEWILTDDGQVCRVLKRGEMRNNAKKEKSYIRTILGTYLVDSPTKMEGEPPRNIYAFAKGSNHYEQRMKKDKKPTSKETMFAKYVANGLPPVDAYLRAFPTNNRKYADHTSKALMKTKRISTLITEEMKANLQKVNIDEEYLLTKTKEIVDKEDGRDGDKLRAIETLMKIAGMFPDNQKTESLTVFQGFSQKELEAIKGSDVKALAHAEKPIED
tara:strand:+ start:3341 stop:4102 length:762 start_codon:yes stop_codon:yes gene_type:complete